MSKQRHTSEFKDEAVRQVAEKGHPVQEVAARLGVSSHSLYKWVKGVRPERDEERANARTREQALANLLLAREREPPHSGSRFECDVTWVG